MRRKKWKKAVLLLLAAGSLAACGQPEESGHQGHQNPAASAVNSMSGDLREETKQGQLPSFLRDADPRVAAIYQTAAKHRTLLEHIPCYCGCGQSAGHRSNKSCFIHEAKADGRIVWDSHGLGCGVCQQIALESARLKEQGKSDMQIRSYIDQKYQEGYAESTPTPMPAK